MRLEKLNQASCALIPVVGELLPYCTLKDLDLPKDRDTLQVSKSQLQSVDISA